MQLKDLKNNPNRAGFDLSRRVLFTAKVGEILPVNCREVLPHDDATIVLNGFGRTAPMNTASYGRIREYYDVYFVPYRLLYSDFNNVINQVNNPTKATSPTSSVAFNTELPKLQIEFASAITNYYELEDMKDEAGMSRAKSARKLLSYLGYRYGDEGPVGRMFVNPFPLLGYHKIYQDFFRNSQWEDASPWTYNVDYLMSEQSKVIDFDPSILEDTKNMFDMEYCNYDKDYFHGLLPRPQYGDTSLATPLIGDLSGMMSTKLLEVNPSSANVPAIVSFEGNPQNNTSTLGYQPTGSGFPTSTNISNQIGITLDENTRAGISVLSIRLAEMQQKWKEITLSSSDLSFKSLLEKHWNVSTSNILSDRCTHLGGIARNVEVSGVVNNNFSVEVSDTEIRGLGQVQSDGTVKFDNPMNEYGMLYVIYHSKPIIEWRGKDTMPKINTKTSVTDYAIPELDSIGMQGVPAIEFMSDEQLSERDLNTDEKLFTSLGYAPRYIDYKTNYDIVLGEFEDTLQNWTLPYSIQDSGNGEKGLTYLDFKVSPHIVDVMFPVNADLADHMRNSIYIDDKVVRSLDANGLPY